MTTKPWMIVCGLAIIAFFKFAGWIGSWSIGLGIIAIVLAVVVLQNVASAQLGTFSKIFLWMFGIAVVVPGLYNAILGEAPLTSEAIEMRKQEADVSTGQRIRPPMLYGVEGILSAANELDDEIGKTLGRKAKNLVDQYSQATGSNTEIIQRELLVLTEEINQHKKYLEQIRLKTTGDQVSFTGFISDLQKSSLRMVMWIICFIGIAVLIASPCFAREWKKLPKGIGLSLAIFGGVFLLDSIVYAEGTVGSPNVPSINMPNLEGQALFWITVAVVVGFIIVSIATKKARWAFIGITIGIAVIAATHFSGWYYGGGYAAEVAAHNRLVASVRNVEKRKESLNPPPSQRGRYNNPVLKVQGLAQKVTINMDEVHWSRPIQWSRDYNVIWEMPGWYEIMLLPTEDRIINRNDGTLSSGFITYIQKIGPVISYPNSMEFRQPGVVKSFIMRGAPGTGTVTVYDNF
ncbi:MAG: hypothetical protein Q8Q95_03600 [bacterium]|nr:hypothetical protein [bacterium]